MKFLRKYAVLIRSFLSNTYYIFDIQIIQSNSASHLFNLSSCSHILPSFIQDILDSIMDAFVVNQPPEGAIQYIHIVQGKENEATPAQLKKIFGSRYTEQTVFQQSWVDNRAKNNPHEKYAFVLGINGTNKHYNCLRCNWSAKGLGKLKTHLEVPIYDLSTIINHL
jgi:hypothetical protein